MHGSALATLGTIVEAVGVADDATQAAVRGAVESACAGVFRAIEVGGTAASADVASAMYELATQCVVFSPGVLYASPVFEALVQHSTTFAGTVVSPGRHFLLHVPAFVRLSSPCRV